MSTLPNRLLSTVVALAILVPSVLLSQVKIREKVEIKPKSPISSRVAESAADTSGLFYKPTLFVWDAISQKPVLTLPSILTISGTVTLGGPINAYQEAVVTYYPNQYQDIQIAWKGRASLASGGAMYEGQNPFTGAFSASVLWSPPDIRLLLFDYSGWGTGSGQLSWPAGQLSSDLLVYSFEGSLWQGGGTYVPVTASALVTGSFQQNVLFDHWYLDAYNTTIPCNSEMELVIMPFDGNWQLYSPYGLSRSDAGIVVKLEGAGDYAYLRSAGHEGHEITTTLADGCTLVFDASRGGFSGESHDVQVTVMGGGKSATLMFTLVCERLDHFQVIANPRMLAPGRSAMVKSIPMDINDQEIPPPGNYDVMFSLSSDDVFWPIWYGPPPLGGFAVDGGDVQPVSLTVPDSVARSGRVSYVVDSSILETFGLDSLKVTIHAVRDDDWSKEGTTEVKVKRTECVTVSVDPDTLAPGGTASVVLGSPGQYPTDQVYDVVLVGGGMLVSPTESGTTLTATLGPVSYVAPATIESTMTVSVFALAYGIGGGMPEETQGGTVALTKKMPITIATQTLSKKGKVAAVAALAKLLADNACTPAKVAIKKLAIPKRLVLTPTPEIVTHSQASSLIVELRDKSENPIPSTEYVGTISFKAGDPIAHEGEGFAELYCGGGQGISLSSVPYSSANSGLVRYVADGDVYLSRFPLRIHIGASLDGTSLADTRMVTLKGDNTVGEYFSQTQLDWGSKDYDKYVDTGATAKAGHIVYYDIGTKGCALSCMAMVLKAFGSDVDPGKLNDWMNDPNNHTSMGRRTGFGDNGNVDWLYDVQYYPGSTVGLSMQVGSKFDPPSTAPMDYNLSLGYPSIVQIMNPKTGHEHWVVVTGKTAGGQYTVLDPDHRNPSVLDPNITKINRYREVLPN